MREALEAVAREELVGAERVLVVNAPRFAHGALTLVDTLPDHVAAGPSFDGALWLCERDVSVGLCRLRAQLKPGARLVTAVELKRSPWAAMRDAFRREQAARPTFEELCEAMLLHGLSEPRVLAASPVWCAVAAALPLDVDPLDDNFAQRG